jgi:eukaryotic-like serine/threonine-protein kinase
MSRVFLASEVRLARQVVIKVLPPELGAGVSAERFEREIRLAARLQHPHIVPLLTAGAAGDLLYYVMPFIEGESLRARLLRERELPLADAARIMREVADALAYAHRSGIVHRDIKPENVLMSQGHAVVTDFGVAKAVSVSTAQDGGTLTSLGVALGTPAYMAPEQAAADPQVDHRADLYALGVVGYEMLCGRTPFLATSAQALIAAHMTEAPDPVARYRPAVPPALSGAVMRCLEKRAADRWQSAAELAAQLDAAAQAPAAIGGPGWARGPGRVAALFALGSIAVLGVVYALVHVLGLPDWVLASAVILLLLGFPIVLGAEAQERRRSLARTIGAPVPSAPALAPWVSRRRALLGGGLAFAALGVVAAGYMAMRLLGIGPVGTLVASGVLEEREPLILAEFENRTPDSTLGRALTEAFRVDLSQSSALRLVDPSTVVEVLRRMERPSDAVLTPALAREVAERQGIKAVVTGQIDPVGKGYVLSASLVGGSDGRILAAVRESADDERELLRAIDELSKKLRERIGESLTTIRSAPKLEQVTTGSLEALRKYTEALRLEENDRAEAAVPLLEEAVALDSGFAMAWRKLAVILGNMFASSSRSVAAATKAYQHRDRLPTLERNLAIGFYHDNVEHDPEKHVAAYRAVLEIDPDNTVALNNLALALNGLRRHAEAESLAVRATRLGRGTAFYINAIQAQLAQGKLGEAQRTADRYSEIAPASPFPEVIQANLSRVRRDLPEAERRTIAIRERHGGSPFIRLITGRSLASLAEAQGRIGEARRRWRALLTDQEKGGTGANYLAAAGALARLEARYGSAGEASAVLAMALSRVHLASLDALDRPYEELVWSYALAGDLDEAGRLLREYDSSVPKGIRRIRFFDLVARGAAAEASGDLDRALTMYQGWTADGNCPSCGAYETGKIHDRRGQVDSAIAAFELVAAPPTLDASIFIDGYALAPSLKRLGELYETRGDRRTAARYYERFVELWKDADPELQPVVREVRARIAQLAQEPGA